MIHPEHVALQPWAQIMPSLRSIAQRLKEHLDDSNCASSEVRVFASSPQQLLLVLLDERCVKIAFLERIYGEGASEELNVRRQPDNVVVLEGHVERLDSFLSRGLVYDALRDHGIVVG